MPGRLAGAPRAFAACKSVFGRVFVLPLMELLLVVVAIIVMASFFIYVYRKENSDAHKQKVKDLEAPARASKALAAARRFAG